MRIAWWLLSALLAAMPVLAQTPLQAQKKLTWEQYEQISDSYAFWRDQAGRYAKILKRANELYPARRNSPLREMNISDEEIRQVDAIKKQYLPNDYLNISPVVTDCACEEGPTCTAQVYVVASFKGRERGLQLSRMNDTWQVGMVQQWWLRYTAVRRQNTGNSYLDDYLYHRAVNDLYEEFPHCVGTLVPAEHSAAAQKPKAAR